MSCHSFSIICDQRIWFGVYHSITMIYTNEKCLKMVLLFFWVLIATCSGSSEEGGNDTVTDCSSQIDSRNGGLVELSNTTSQCKWIIRHSSIFHTNNMLLLYKSTFEGELTVYTFHGDSGNVTLLRTYTDGVAEFQRLSTSEGFVIQANFSLEQDDRLKFSYFSYLVTHSSFFCKLTSPDAFFCEISAMCIPGQRHCDGIKHCIRGDDEYRNCEKDKNYTCHYLKKACADGRCVSIFSDCVEPTPRYPEYPDTEPDGSYSGSRRGAGVVTAIPIAAVIGVLLCASGACLVRRRMYFQKHAARTSLQGVSYRGAVLPTPQNISGYIPPQSHDNHAFDAFNPQNPNSGHNYSLSPGFTPPAVIVNPPPSYSDAVNSAKNYSPPSYADSATSTTSPS